MHPLISQPSSGDHLLTQGSRTLRRDGAGSFQGRPGAMMARLTFVSI